MAQSLYSISDTRGIVTPALVVFPELVAANISEMIRIAGSPGRLRPHCKTHKMREVVEMQLARGVTKQKCATIAEAEMLARAGVKDIVWAYNPVGPNIGRVVKFMEQFPDVRLAVTADHPRPVEALNAAMLEAVAVAIHAVSLANIPPGSTALVLGAGTIGLLVLQALRAAGCPRVFVSDIDDSRLKLAKELGATDVVNAGADAVGKVLELTSGIGVDLAVEAVGRNETVDAAINCVRKGGTVVLVGNISPEVTLPLQKVVTRQIRLQGSCASAGEYPKAIDLMAKGTIRVKPLITAVAPLDDGPQWFERLYAHEPNLMKVVLTPGNAS